SAQIAGFAYDLSPLARDIALVTNTTTPPSTASTKYAINPCAPLQPPPDSVPALDRCPAHAWVCRSLTYVKDGVPRLEEVGSLAGVAKGDSPTLQATAQGSDRPKEFHWKMDGAQVDGATWATDIRFVCDRKAKNEDLPTLVAFKDGLLQLEWAVPAACALGDDGKDDGGKDKAPGDGNGNDDDDDSEGGSGFFATVLTLLVSLFILYFVLGVMYNYLVVRATGLDLIPNRAFWREFPYLCADFAQHIWDTVSGRRRGGYSVV
ncbi:type II membrane protein, partial [Coemansia sp. RSA 2703]